MSHVMNNEVLSKGALEARYARMRSVGQNPQTWKLWNSWEKSLKGQMLVAAELDPIEPLLEDILGRLPEQGFIVAGRDYPLYATVAQAEGVTKNIRLHPSDLIGATIDFDHLLIDASGALIMCASYIPPEFHQLRAEVVAGFVSCGHDTSLTPPILHASLARPTEEFRWEDLDVYCDLALDWGAVFRSRSVSAWVGSVTVARAIDFLTRKGK